jgi:hypothetical protein
MSNKDSGKRRSNRSEGDSSQISFLEQARTPLGWCEIKRIILSVEVRGNILYIDADKKAMKFK